MYKTIVSGNLGRDAEVKEKNGKKFITFPMANTEKRNGEPVTTWFQCFIHNQKMVDSSFSQYLKKGTKVLIEGRQFSEIWNKEDNTQQITHSILVYTAELMGSSSGHQQPENMAAADPSGAKKEDSKDDDDLPF